MGPKSGQLLPIAIVYLKSPSEKTNVSLLFAVFVLGSYGVVTEYYEDFQGIANFSFFCNLASLF